MTRSDRPQTDAALVTLASVTDADLTTLAQSPTATALFDHVISTDTPTAGAQEVRRFAAARPPTRRVVISFAAAAAAAAAIIAGAVVLAGSPTVKPPTVMSPVAFDAAEKGYIVARVTNPRASAASLNAAFKRQGLNMTVKLVAVSPSIVGTIEAQDVRGGNSTSIEPILNRSCVTGGGACPIAIRIARDFTGSAQIEIGRPAKSGEAYTGAADPTAPGEALHCTSLYDSTIARILPLLRAKGFTAITWMSDTISSDGHAITNREPMPHATSYIRAADLEASNRIMIWTTPRPTDPALIAPGNPSSPYERALNRGCTTSAHNSPK